VVRIVEEALVLRVVFVAFGKRPFNIVIGLAGETDRDEGCDLLLGLDVLKDFKKE